MGWIGETAMVKKERFIIDALANKKKITDLCKEYMISRECGYKWLKRYKNEGLDGLKEKSRKPNRSPYKTPEEIEKKILSVRNRFPTWGGRKIKAFLQQRNELILPEPSTITRILHRQGKISKEKSRRHKAFIRFEHEKPNQLWQMDFKGHFRVGESPCYPLTILDDHSRYSLSLKACKNERYKTVKDALINIFQEYGMPERMTMDNGNPWGSSTSTQGITKLEVWLILQGIYVSHSRPLHPQTQGKDERFHRTLKEDLLSRREFNSFEEVQEGFDEWRHCYNYERPHEACGMYPPSRRHKVSNKSYKEHRLLPEYEVGSFVNKVSKTGYLRIKEDKYYIGESLGGLNIKILESERIGILEVYLHHQKIKEIDLVSKKIAKRIK